MRAPSLLWPSSRSAVVASVRRSSRLGWRSCSPGHGRWSSTTPARPSTSRPASEPLHILFCGSDDFSCASLQALHDEMARQQRGRGGRTGEPGQIASLRVVVRPAKRTGRGLKTMRESPTSKLAAALGLCVYERDTFTGWQPPPVNMVIAVSFGLFVPPRILRAALYGGLNVHPSLLPDLRGASPIEHAILSGHTRTGVTVQTLDDCRFDHGRVLLQGPLQERTSTSASTSASTPASTPALGIDLPPRTTAASLRRLLAPIGADLLVQTLRRGLYLPDTPASSLLSPAAAPTLVAAPRLTKADGQVPWTDLAAADDVDRRARALGPLWTHLAVSSPRPGPRVKRVILQDMSLVACPRALLSLLRGHEDRDRHPADETCPLPTLTFIQHSAKNSTHGHEAAVTLPFVAADDDEAVILPVAMASGHLQASLCLRVGTIKVEGDRSKPAARALGAFRRDNEMLNSISWHVVMRG